MRINDRGGYDVVLSRTSDGLFLSGDDIDDPQWVDDVDLARSAQSDDDMLSTAAMYGFVDDNGILHNDVVMQHVAWVNPDIELDERFYDEDNDIVKYDAIEDYVRHGGTTQK